MRRREIKNGNVSLYLAINVDGRRSYEYLKLYLVPETSSEARRANKETLRVANAVKAQRTLEVQAGRFGLQAVGAGGDVLLRDFVQLISDERERRDYVLRGLLHNIDIFNGGSSIRLRDVDKAWIDSFTKFLTSEHEISVNYGRWAVTYRRALTSSSCLAYLNKLSMVMNEAIRRDMIVVSPFRDVRKPQAAESVRSYLTIEELRLLRETPCGNRHVRDAFMFSCLTGLRWSDVIRLRWSDVTVEGGVPRIVFRQKKTRGLEYMDINSQAYDILKGRGKSGDALLFGDDLKYAHTALKGIRRWVEAAGIKKHVTFHSGRHTFAVMMLSLGVDLYTVSKLLGHRDIKTTQIYAKILDETKRDAVSRIPEIL